MEELNLPPQESGNKEPNFMKRNHLAIKFFVIGFLTLLLLIPISMISNLIREREETSSGAVSEVHQKWGGEQNVIGPILTIPYSEKEIVNGKESYSIKQLQLLPKELGINGTITSEKLKRGLHDIVVYNSSLDIDGSFVLPEAFDNIDRSAILFDQMTLNVEVSDLRGICKNVELVWGDEKRVFNPGIEDCKILNNGVSIRIDPNTFTKSGNQVKFAMNLQLKGSKSLMFAPIGEVTKVNLKSNCDTPSFTGAFLPETRETGENGFAAQWTILHFNRSYPQVFSSDGYRFSIDDSLTGVNLLLPVQQYQQSMRSVKYAILIIILTFVVSFFVEIIEKRKIHPFQYLLVGLGLSLFYSLLLSISEHLGFNIAYLISSVMTVSLITFYMLGVLKIRKSAFTIGGLLSSLYAYIFVLIQMETYSLLVGSVGLFVILAVIMYYSQKIKLS